MGTGTGLIIELAIKQCQKLGLVGRFIGIDPNPISLEIARRIHPPDSCVVELIEGDGELTDQLVAGKIPAEGVDITTIHDALHEIEGDEKKRNTLEAMARILRPGGIFTYNSAFTSNAMTLEYGKWKLEVGKLAGLERNRQIKALKYYKPQEYVEMIRQAGLEIVYEVTKKVYLSRQALEDISRYPAFIEGFFRDLMGVEKFSLEQKSDLLVKALDGTLTRLEVGGLDRVWHEVIAQKPATKGSLAGVAF